MSIGNPWGAAAQSYGQDLDQLTKIQMGGMQQAAQMPLQLYDRFMDGYEKARQRAAQEKQMEMQQAQLDRQNRLADLQFQKDTENEAYRRRQENLKLVLDANKDITATGKEIGLDYTPDMRERFKAQLVDPLMQKGLPKLDAQLRAEKLLPALKATPIPNVQINEGEEAVPLLPSDYRVGQGFTGEDTFMGQRPAQIEQARIRDEAKDAAAAAALALKDKIENRREAENLRRLDQGDRRIDMLGARLTAKDKAITLEDASPAEMSLIDMIGTYKGLPEKVLGRGQDRARILAMVAQKYPSYDVGNAAQHYKFLQDLASTRTGTAGGTVNSTNRMIEHADELHGIINDTGGAEGWIGKIGNIATYPSQMMTGNEERFNTVRDKLLSETEKLVSGGVPHIEQMRRDVANLKFTDPIDKKKRILAAVLDVGLAQTGAIEEQRRNILRDNDPGTTFISPTSLEKVNKLLKAIGKPELKPKTTSRGYDDPGTGSPSAKTITRKQQNTALNKTRITYSDGTVEEKDGLL